MTNALTQPLVAAETEVLATGDLIERYMAARENRAEIAASDRRHMEIQRDVVWKLYEGRTWAEVGKLLHISGSRAEAIARGR